MKLSHDPDADTLTITFSEPDAPARCEEIDLLPFVRALVTPPKRRPPPGFKVIDDEAWRANVLIHRITISDVSLHNTGQEVGAVASAAAELVDLADRLEGLERLWSSDSSKREALHDLRQVISSVGRKRLNLPKNPAVSHTHRLTDPRAGL